MCPKLTHKEKGAYSGQMPRLPRNANNTRTTGDKVLEDTSKWTFERTTRKEETRFEVSARFNGI